MNAIDLRLATHERDGWGIVEVAGEIDMLTAPKLREALLAVIGEGRHRVVVDMLGVTFMDSTGLGTLVGALKRVKEHPDGALLLACDNRSILRVLTITGLDNVLPIHPSVDEAVRAG